MKNLLFVFLGGGAGSCARYLLGLALNPIFVKFPLGTFAANSLSCFVAGVVLAFLDAKANAPWSAETKLLILTGFCGGFSTFSTLSGELFRLLEAKAIFAAAFYAAASFSAGLFCLWAGWALAGR